MVLVVAAVVALLASALGTGALNYTLCHEWKGNDFSKQFYWWDYPDPTHGQVKCVDLRAAKELTRLVQIRGPEDGSRGETGVCGSRHRPVRHARRLAGAGGAYLQDDPDARP